MSKIEGCEVDFVGGLEELVSRLGDLRIPEDIAGALDGGLRFEAVHLGEAHHKGSEASVQEGAGDRIQLLRGNKYERFHFTRDFSAPMRCLFISAQASFASAIVAYIRGKIVVPTSITKAPKKDLITAGEAIRFKVLRA